MKTILVMLCLVTSAGLARQTDIEKEIAYDAKPIVLTFDDADEVNVRGWDEGRVLVKARVLINLGENDDAFILESSSSATTRVSGYIKDKDDLPQMVVIKKNDQKYYFKGDSWDSPEVQKFISEHGRDGYDWMSHGVAREIQITVFVPRRSTVEVYSRHGIIDVEQFEGPLKADSKHGGVDVEVNESVANKFNLETQWGAIYTNLNFTYNKKEIGKEHNHWTKVEAVLQGGQGPLLELQSKHGNLYVRKL